MVYLWVYLALMICPDFAGRLDDRSTGLARFERATYRLGGGCSIQLSYSPKANLYKDTPYNLVRKDAVRKIRKLAE